MINKAKIYYDKTLAGYLERTDSGYRFSYDSAYIKHPKAKPISLTLPISIYPYNYHKNNEKVFKLIDQSFVSDEYKINYKNIWTEKLSRLSI